MTRRTIIPRAAAWGCLVLLAVLSWLPGDAMVRTGIGGHIEHGVAYLGATVVVGLASSGRIGPWPLLAGLCAYGGLLELGQLAAPGRHASAWDFLASAAGVVGGGTVIWRRLGGERRAYSRFSTTDGDKSSIMS